MRADEDVANFLRNNVPGSNDRDTLRNMANAMTEGAKTRQVVLREEVPSETKGEILENAPIDGIISQVAFDFPAGSERLLKAAFKVNDERISPEKGFFALNDSTTVFDFSEQVTRRDKLQVEVRNEDTDNDHSIEVIVNITQNPGAVANNGSMSVR